MVNAKGIKWVVLTLIVLVNWQCYEHEEGCMDVRAENYSVESDKPCEDCCKYPDLILEVMHRFEEEEVDTNFIFSLGNDSFRIRSLNFYLSDIAFSKGQDDEKSIEESIAILPQDASTDQFESVIFPVVKINITRTSAYNIGSFKYADIYDAMHLDFGIRERINHANMQQIPSSNALYQNQDSMYINQTDGFYFLKMTISYIGETEKNIQIFGDASLIPLIFDQEFDFSAREDRVLSLTVNYAEWFKNIDFLIDSEASVIQKLKSNLENGLVFE